MRNDQPVELLVSQEGGKCVPPLAAKVTYVSSQAEYTPPVLYSKEQRYKLMYLVEARPAPGAGAALRPGQPVDVRPQ